MCSWTDSLLHKYCLNTPTVLLCNMSQQSLIVYLKLKGDVLPSQCVSLFLSLFLKLLYIGGSRWCWKSNNCTMLFPSTLILLHAQLGNHTGLLVTQQVVLCLVKHSVYKFNIFILHLNGSSCCETERKTALYLANPKRRSCLWTAESEPAQQQQLLIKG